MKCYSNVNLSTDESKEENVVENTENDIIITEDSIPEDVDDFEDDEIVEE